MLARSKLVSMIEQRLREFPVVALVGARQVGKSTLARSIARERGTVEYFDLERERDLARLAEPSLALEGLRGLVVLDEIQRRPELFPTLRVLADRPRKPARFLVLGSASPDLLRQSSESLAGRIAYVEIDGFTLDEVGVQRVDRLWLRGSFPLSFLAKTEAQSMRWRQEFVRTFLERDIPSLGFRAAPALLERFWKMLAHWHGQLWNASELGRSLGLSDATMRHHLDLMASTFALRVLAPFHENLAKRQVKAPKVYVADSGILHALLGIERRSDLEAHPKLGASFEGYAIQQVIRHLGARRDECFFWRTHDGAELDLLVVRGQRRLGFEVKRTDAPKLTPGMRSALADLSLDRLDIVHAGKETFTLHERVRAVAMSRVLTDVKPL
jgi:predicted AAA+ superfamily ATPase